MVTLPLQKMATRVAMSLCYATGYGDEMVVNRYIMFIRHALIVAIFFTYTQKIDKVY